MKRALEKNFFERPALVVAKGLLGKYLVRRIGKKAQVFMITEVEAYDGFKDRASHAFRGKTERTKVMFGPAGFWYVYFTYGMHWMLNIVTGKKEYPAAVLIRGINGVNGPARITKRLRITKRFNEKRAMPKNGLWIEDRGIRISASKIRRGPRIGVKYAGRVWANKPYRFWVENNI